MSFFKKIMQKEELTAEQQAERDLRSAQKNAEAEAKKAEKKAKKDERERERQEDLERFFGPNPGAHETTLRLGYTFAIDRVRDKLLNPGETVIATVASEYEPLGGKEIKGVLVATDQKLVFSSNTVTKEFTEIMDYKSMGSITLGSDGFLKKELHIISGREKRVFDDIRDDQHLSRFLDGVRNRIALAHAGTTSASTPPPSASSDKYEQLEKLSKLKDQGILTTEEFQSEKNKLLNS